MIQIDRLRMRLPSGFEHRAASIARTVGKLLARQSTARQLSIDVLNVSAQGIHANTSDDEIAHIIVKQLNAHHPGAG